jgi:hypothetical protein
VQENDQYPNYFRLMSTWKSGQNATFRRRSPYMMEMAMTLLKYLSAIAAVMALAVAVTPGFAQADDRAWINKGYTHGSIFSYYADSQPDGGADVWLKCETTARPVRCVFQSITYHCTDGTREARPAGDVGILLDQIDTDTIIADRAVCVGHQGVRSVDFDFLVLRA